MFYDPIYMMLAIVGMALVFIPQMLVKSTYSKYSKVRSSTGMTGAQVAESILRDNGIYDVRVEPIQGELTDHYDPSDKVIKLSENVYGTNSIAAQGVAAHEVGHAIQDSKGYLPMKMRAGFFPLVNLGQFLGPLLLMAGLGLRFFLHTGFGGLVDLLALIGIAMYGSVVLFHIITLPVELNASFRAVKALANGGYVVDDEIVGAKKVLSAAALTYVATALYALMELLYWIWVFFGRSRE